MSYVYLASPYTHPLKSIMASRFEEVMSAVVTCAKENVPVYSPIVHWHIPALTYRLPPTEEFWRIQNAGMLARCAELWVLAIPGWNESAGIQWEMKQVSMNRVLNRVPVLILPSNIKSHCKAFHARNGG